MVSSLEGFPYPFPVLSGDARTTVVNRYLYLGAVMSDHTDDLLVLPISLGVGEEIREDLSHSDPIPGDQAVRLEV